MTKQEHKFRKRPGAKYRCCLSMTEEDEKLFDQLETKITASMPDEPMNRSKAFSFILKYARNFMEIDDHVGKPATETKNSPKLSKTNKKLSK